MTPDERTTLKNLLTRQRDIYGRMAALVNEQARLLKTGDAAGILPLAEQSSGLKMDAEALQTEIDPLKAAWENDRESIPEDEREVLRSLMTAIGEHLQSLLTAMEQLKSDIDGERDDRRDRLRDLQRGQAARRGYTSLGRTPKDPRFMDRNE